MNRDGRICLCGAISSYNAADPVPGPKNLSLCIGKRITLRGMIVGDHMNVMPHYLQTAAGWLRDGSLRADETVVEGIEHGLDAFFGLMKGANTGQDAGQALELSGSPPRSRSRAPVVLDQAVQQIDQLLRARRPPGARAAPPARRPRCG